MVVLIDLSLSFFLSTRPSTVNLKAVPNLSFTLYCTTRYMYNCTYAYTLNKTRYSILRESTFLSVFQGNLWGGGPKREGGQFPHPEVAVGEDREVKPLASSQSLEIFYYMPRPQQLSISQKFWRDDWLIALQTPSHWPIECPAEINS
jgi:hypothetical protein